MIKNRSKHLVSLAIAVVFICWTSAVLAQSPKTAEEYNNRGLDRQNSGDLDGAIADYTKAISLKGNAITIATSYNNRANAYMAKNDFAAAVADYGSAIQLQPANFENYYNRGIASYNKGDLDAAFAGATIPGAQGFVVSADPTALRSGTSLPGVTGP